MLDIFLFTSPQKCGFRLVPETIAPNEVNTVEEYFSKQTSDNGTYQYLFCVRAVDESTAGLTPEKTAACNE